MKLNLTNKFKKEASKLITRNPSLRNKLSDVLKIISEDPFYPTLKTHKLKGEHDELWALSLTFELRIKALSSHSLSKS
jgi:mRNA-degrading endonuclease YafQ of YafQ-DinJ toxin-antitoxin module